MDGRTKPSLIRTQSTLWGQNLTRAGTRGGRRRCSPRERVPASCQGYRLGRAIAATIAGPEFEKAMRPILEGAGPLPHGRLQLAIGASSHSNRRKSRLLGRSSASVAIAATLFIPRDKWLELARSPLLPKARSNGHAEDAISHDPVARNHAQRISSCRPRIVSHRRLICHRRDFVTG
jgi:hypothetical protein